MVRVILYLVGINSIRCYH